MRTTTSGSRRVRSTPLSVAENNLYVKVQGTVAQVQSAFGVKIHNYIQPESAL
jgi:subtilase family serine protease